MSKKIFLRLALPTPLRRFFDYLPPVDWSPQVLEPGIRVLVPFQSRQLVGILVELTHKASVPAHKLKAATKILDETPVISTEIFNLCRWVSDYYHASLGEVLVSSLPTRLRKEKVVKFKKFIPEISNDVDDLPILNSFQQTAVTTICEAQHTFQTFLLDGVTGSGKTEVYLRSIEFFLALNQQVLILVPEISLTPQTITRFQQRFKIPIVTLHSDLSDGKRLQSWLAAKNGDARIVIGTRSAIFTPFQNLGLIIVDEEHDTSFKQQERFRYHARDVAIMRGSMQNLPVVLGSATPSLESLLNVKRKRFIPLVLPDRAGISKLPAFAILNLQQTKINAGLSQALIKLLKLHLEQKNQVMLFLNRRGFAPVLYCPACAWIAECKSCDARMVYHRVPEKLKCHHCNAVAKIPTECKQCHATPLHPIGLGTQRLEEILQQEFPEVPIIRIDRDSTRKKNSLQALLAQVNTLPSAILLGTQMLAKGHHFPNVTLVGIVDIDAGLFSVDFRAAEQMGQLILQVAGRAGRAHKLGTVALQTRHPNHTLLQTLIYKGYANFAEMLLNERQLAQLPPFSHLTIFRAEAYKQENAYNFLTSVKTLFATNSELKLLGPVAGIMTKRKGLYSQHLLLQSDKRKLMQEKLKQVLLEVENLAKNHAVKWILDVDPLEV